MPDTVPLYDAFSAQYDFFVDWPQRLRSELPFIEKQLAAIGARRVLDAACGTGQHAIALAEAGYEVIGADLSAGMIEQARKNAAGSQAQFLVTGFGRLLDATCGGFDALLCLGNSLPHVTTREALQATLSDFEAVLRPGGLLLLQSRNFDAVMATRARWIGPQSHTEGGREWLFVRFYDFNLDGTLTFNVVSLQREGAGAWTQHAEATTLYPWLRRELEEALEGAGFAQRVCYGSMEGSAFDKVTSGDLVVVATKE